MSELSPRYQDGYLFLNADGDIELTHNVENEIKQRIQSFKDTFFADRVYGSYVFTDLNKRDVRVREIELEIRDCLQPMVDDNVLAPEIYIECYLVSGYLRFFIQAQSTDNFDIELSFSSLLVEKSRNC